MEETASALATVVQQGKARYIGTSSYSGGEDPRDAALLKEWKVPQLALAWTLRDPRVTSALIGASRPEQIVESVGALRNLNSSAEELAQIDRFAREGGINLWEKPSTAE
ncbi:L-glyceraldehyde 3-phosphate reductase [Pseudomonas chlororaphis]|nr:L-glyceraldehyde 3-phosphate reductase [Pseudomonas chlororaphis]